MPPSPINSLASSALYLSRPGLLSALGSGCEASSVALFAGVTEGLRQEEGWLFDGPHSKPVFVGSVRTDLPAIPPQLRRHQTRNNQLLLAALAQIRDAVDQALERYGPGRVGVVLGSSTSGIAEGGSAIAAHHEQGAWPPDFFYEQMELGDPALFLARHLALEGPAYTVSTACTASGKALASARNLIRAGLCDAMITGGVDSLCRLTLGGFDALESLAPQRCQPLSVDRAGINIGEGAALFVLSATPSPVQLLGIGESSDAHHISAPEPTGRGAEAAMRAALCDANVLPEQIGYLNLHATATPKNDAMESLAVSRVFPQGVPVSGTKPLTGHTLGAAGAIEAAFCWLAIADPEGRLPPHIWNGQPDPQLPPLQLVRHGQCFTQVSAGETAISPAICRADGRRIAMSNSFAFGGNNLSLILAAAVDSH
jgi:3-oxoacyl-[acyl-carrier-protein] synthase I